MEKKVLGVCRVSTTSQEIQSQIDELRQFIYKDGYQENDIIWITGYGCSAVKEDEQFRYNINEIHKHIQSGDISKIYCWALDRVARRKVTMDILIEDLVEHKVDMIVKEPSRMQLLNDDGSRNDSMELAISLFVHLAEAEMRNKKARFARGKSNNRAAGRYNGGNTVRYGYKVGEGGYFVINEEQADIVRLAFDLYADGYTLSRCEKEMKERGYEFATVNWLHKLLNEKAYIGKGLQKYPRIISDEVFDKVQELKKKNLIVARTKKHYYFGSKLIKCKCGKSYIASHDQYVCNCGESDRISIANIDGLLWFIAFDKEGGWMYKNDKDNKANIRKEMAVLQRKVSAADNAKAKVEIKRQRALNAYLDGNINDEQYKQRMNIVNDEFAAIEKSVSEWIDSIRKMENMLNDNGVDLKKKWMDIIDNISSADEKEMKAIVAKWINRVDLNLPFVKVTCVDGKEYTAKYHIRAKKHIWTTMGGGYLPIYPIRRDDEKAYVDNPKEQRSNQMKAMYRYEQSIGVVEIVNNIGLFWKNSIL